VTGLVDLPKNMMIEYKMQYNIMDTTKNAGALYNSGKNRVKAVFNGTLPPNSTLVDGPNEIYAHGIYYYAKVGFLWKSWKAFPTLEAARIAKGVKGGARRKTRGRGRKARKTRGRRS